MDGERPAAPTPDFTDPNSGDPDALAREGQALQAAGRLEEALHLIGRASALAPERPELHLLRGCLLRDTGQPAAAADAFRDAAATGGGWALPQLYYWRLLADAGTVGESIPLGHAMAEAFPDFAEEILSDIALHQARRDRWAEALDAYRRLAALHDGVRAMLGEALCGAAPMPDGASLLRRAAEAASDTPPPMAGRFAPAFEAGGWRGKRVLVLMPRHIQNSPRFIENDLARYLGEAAAEAGLETLFIAADDVTYPRFMTPERRAASASNLRAIAEQVRAFAPDIVAVDGNSVGDEDTINPRWLRALQAELSFRSVCVLPDNYGDTAARNAYWAEGVDALVHGVPHSGEGERLILVYVPVPACFHGGEERDSGGLFVGSASGGGLGHRALWLSALMTEVPGSRVILGDRLAAASPNLAEYAALHRRARFSVNFGRRANGHATITGRAYESIKAGCLLLDQAGSGLDRFFTEGKHYLSFADAGEMVALGRHLLADEPNRAAMAADAQAFMERHYAARFFWPYVIGRVMALPPRAS